MSIGQRNWAKRAFRFALYSPNSTVMPRKSKLAISHIQNLGSSAKKWSSVTIEDVEDEGELQYNQSPSHSDQRDLEADEQITIIGYLDDLKEEPLPDLMSDIPDQDSDSEVDDEFEEIREVLDLEMFANTLAEAQRVAVETEDKRLKEYNCPLGIQQEASGITGKLGGSSKQKDTIQ